MGYTLDYFVGNLRCPVCDVVSDADESTNMCTKIRSQPELAFLGVGHPFEIESSENMQASGYLVIQAPQPDREIYILQTWECPSCGSPFNWAEIVVFNGVIIRITAVPLNREVFDKAHFISDECIYEIEDLTNRSFTELLKADLVQILRELL